MRGLLDFVYRASGALAAFLMVAICGVVLLQVGANIVDKFMEWTTGEPIGLVIPSYADFAGFFLVGATFLALPYTLRRGSHIRVTLVLQAFGPRTRHVAELWCVLAAGLLSGYFTVYVIRLALDSHRYGDVSYGMVPVPLWIPQTAMALGLAVLTLAFADEFVSILRGARPTYEDGGESLLDQGRSAAAGDTAPGEH